MSPHEHWHIDISHINVCGTFYYLLSVLDGFRRYIVHWELRESMTEQEVEIILQRAKERFPDTTPRIISDNGPQFIARDFKEFIRVSGMTHVRTSPYYPQSNGKLERWHEPLKREGLRPRTTLSLDDARRIATEFVAYYNNERLNSAIGYIAPKDQLEGRAAAIHAQRERKLAAAREARKARRGRSESEHLTGWREVTTIHPAGETDASSAGAQLARDSRPGFRQPRWERQQTAPASPLAPLPIPPDASRELRGLPACALHADRGRNPSPLRRVTLVIPGTSRVFRSCLFQNGVCPIHAEPGELWSLNNSQTVARVASTTCCPPSGPTGELLMLAL
ncbi:MAG: DDE-type integrase/transposase/recombinase [Planctomycetota bacterium]